MNEKRMFVIAGVAAIVVGTLFMFAGFGGDFSSSVNKNTAAGAAVAVPFVKVAEGEKSRISERVNFLIISQEELEELWTLIDTTAALPVIDFSTHFVIAVFAGSEPSASIEIAKIEDTNARTVSITLAKPAEACVEGALLTSPYEIATVPVTTLPFTHKDISTVAECPK